ncbi:MAG: hypothetical protein Q9227_002195 [Pyrenula ochraceoflavens]
MGKAKRLAESLRGVNRKRREDTRTRAGTSKLISKTDEEQLISWLEPMIFPCRTIHIRLFPQKHSFSYSYLFVGIPVGWKGAAGSLLSTENRTLGRAPRTWFSVEAEDYLARGSDSRGLSWKLWTYLRSQDLNPQDFGHVYLVTAPRFLGYSFNPVSFWYLYNREKRLAAMILEVNNTFDERRMYLLKPESSGEYTRSASHEITFAETWAKDFHVSPFNDRDGFYVIKAIDPFASGRPPKVDCKVTLRTAERRPKLVARVFSTGQPSLPAAMGHLKSLSFVLSWWWVGLTTDVRILREARKLWFKGLQVFYRPEIMTSSIGRKATPEEAILEKWFQAWLKSICESSEQKMRVEYNAAVNSDVSASFGVSNHQNELAASFVVRILSPEFYRSLIYHESVEAALRHNCFKKSPSEMLVWLSNSDSFWKIFDTQTADACASHVRDPSYCSTSPIRVLKQSLVGRFRLSSNKSVNTHCSLESFVLKYAKSAKESEEYYNAVIRLALADLVAFGSISLLRIFISIIWLLLLIGASSAFDRSFDILMGHHPTSVGAQLVQIILQADVLHIAHLFMTTFQIGL